MNFQPHADQTARTGFTSAVVTRMKTLAASDLPEQVRTIGKQCILDWFGVAIAGSREPLVRILMEQAAFDGGNPVSTILCNRRQFSIRQAALVNGAMGHAIDYDDVNVAGHGHITAAVLPAALAMSEARRVGGDDLLRAFIAGYEAAVMVGRYVGRRHYDHGFHGTATIGSFGAASAASVIMALDTEASARALGIAGTQAAGLKAQFGTMCKPFHAGKSNENGVVAAQLAARGFTGRDDILECAQGFSDTQSPEPNVGAGLAAARGGAHISDNLFKYSAACFGTHGAIESIRRIRAEHALSPEQIRHVRIRVEPGADRMCNIREPRTGLETKFSLRFNAALALAARDTSSPETYSDRNARQPDLCDLRDKVEVQIMPAGWPIMVTEVDIGTVDGRVYSGRHDTGIPSSNLEEQSRRLHEKFFGLTEPVVGKDRAKEIAQAIDSIESVVDVRDMMSIVRHDGLQ